MALYHLNNSLLDSSLLATKNTLTSSSTTNGTTTPVSNAFGNYRIVSNGQFLSAPSSGSLEQLSRGGTLTLEGFFRFTSNSFTSAHLASHSSGGSDGWQWSIARVSGTNTYQQKFTFTPSGGSPITYTATARSLNANTWYFFAVTYDLGRVTFFRNGTQIGQFGTQGDPAVASTRITVPPTSALLLLGKSPTANATFPGLMDEIRLSRIVRPSLATPTLERSAD
jgi:hypothetical protein